LGMPHYLRPLFLLVFLSPATSISGLKKRVKWQWEGKAVGCGGDEDWLVRRGHQVVFTGISLRNTADGLGRQFSGCFCRKLHGRLGIGKEKWTVNGRPG